MNSTLRRVGVALEQRTVRGLESGGVDMTGPTTAPATPTVAVLLAAGAGTRLGHGPKALLPHRGGTLVEHPPDRRLLGVVAVQVEQPAIGGVDQPQGPQRAVRTTRHQWGTTQCR